MSAEQPNSTLWSRVSLRAGLLTVGAVCLAVVLWEGRTRGTDTRHGEPSPSFPTRLPAEEITRNEAEREAQPVSDGYRREVERPKPVQAVVDPSPPREASSGDPPPGGPANRRRDEKRTLPELFRMPPDPAQAAKPAPEERRDPPSASTSIGGPFAPFGRLIKCQLVETLDSVTARSEPIVALVTEDLDWNGRVIIPAGTEAYSYAKPEASLDASGVGRLVDNGEWTLVLPAGAGGGNGRELILKARALDRGESVVGPRGLVQSWGPSDGADGLVGATLSTLDDREIKLFVAAAISGMAQGIGAVAQRQVAAPGIPGVLGATQIAPTLGNALAGSLGTGATEVMNQVAGRIRDEIAKRGAYVRVPAGKAFYLFVEQTIDPGAAAVGLRLPPEKGRHG